MSNYVSDYVDELKRLGADRMTASLAHPVLVLSGVAGTLREQRTTGTAVTDLSDTLKISQLVGRVFPLSKRKDSPPGPIVVGRSSESDVSIADYSISKRHCFLILGSRTTQLVDCGSTNGTLVQGRPAPAKQPLALHGGETLVLGRFAFLFLPPAAFVDYLATQR